MPALSIMIKPASSLCNMRCKYCFYHALSKDREMFSYGMMTDETAKNIITKALDFAAGESVYFAFQGGEPTLRGLEFFETFVKTVKENNHKNSIVYYALQTNGTLIDEAWARFFKENNFLIGLSLDGDKSSNRFRLDSERKETFSRVMETVRLFRIYEVEFNILTVATAATAKNIERIYRWMTDQDFRYLQFIPCLRPFGDKSESELYMNVNEYGDYLIRLFNLYVKDYVRGKYTSVREMDNLVRQYLGERPEQCGISGHCSHQFVVEGDGSVFPCDFYCVDEWKLGNIADASFDKLAHSEKAVRFIKESFVLKAECSACRFFGLCRGGGCKRSRADRDYCEAYKRFYSACLPLFRVFCSEKTQRKR